MGKTIREIFIELLTEKYIEVENDAIVNGCDIVKETKFKWTIHGYGYNDHYNAVMSYFSSHELNILKRNAIYPHQRIPIWRNGLFNHGIGISPKIKRRLIHANDIGLITLF